MNIELRQPTSLCPLCSQAQYEYDENSYTQHSALCERYRTLERIVASLVLAATGEVSEQGRDQIMSIQKGTQPKLSLDAGGIHVETADD